MGRFIGFVCVAASAVAAAEGDGGTWQTVPRPWTTFHEGAVPAAELESVRLREGERAVTGPVAELTIGRTLAIETRWTILSRRFDDAEMRMIVRRPGYAPSPAFLKRVSVGADPAPIGTTVTVQHELALERREFVGDGLLWLSLYDEGKGWEDRADMFFLPVRVPPVLWPSAAPRATVAEHLDALHTLTRASFRLGPATEIDLPLSGDDPPPMTGIAVFSAFSHDPTVRTGDAVCRIEGLTGSGDVLHTWTLEYGRHTGPNTTDGDGAAVEPVYEREDEHQGTGDGVPLHYYRGRFLLESPAPVAALRFEYVRAEGALDVDEIAVLPAEPEEG